jgi:hypothetical protein
MNRIYQGKVTAVEIPDGKDEQGKPKWKNLENWQSALWQHHELFQDAVNYYSLCLAALAKGLELEEFARKWADQAAERAANDPKLKKQKDRDEATAEAREMACEQIRAARGWREAVRKTWTEAQRKAIKFPGPHRRLASILGVEPDEADSVNAFDACAGKALANCQANQEAQAAAFLQLLDEASNRDLNQVCNELISPLCAPQGKCDYTPKTVVAGQEAERARQAKMIHEATEHTLQVQLEKFEPGRFVTKMPTEFSCGKDARAEALKQFKAAAAKATELAGHEGAFTQRLVEIGDELKVPRLGRKPSGLYPFALVLRLWPSVVAWAVFKRATETLLKRDAAAVTSDPVADARVTDIPVFEYLTNRVLHRASDDRNQAVWKEFDVAAFLEAIKRG